LNNTLSFPEWLKKRRKALDLTHDKLADLVGCSPNTLRKLESGERRPSQQLAERLAEQLQIAPTDRAAFMAFARTGLTDATLAAPLPPLHAAHASVHDSVPIEPIVRVPRPLTRIIGREADLRAVRRYLLEARVPLVTLLGPAGVGKTRLSQEVAASLRETFRDGVVFVPLAAIRDPELVLAAIAQAFALKNSGNRPVDSLLQHMLHDRHLLLVLDNFEQVMGAAPAIAALLGACPQLQIVVTSRIRLGIRGEQLLPIPPLALPDLSHLPGATALQGVPAVALFVERVQSVVPDFTLTDADGAAVAAICARLDGLPLAIELVAARCTMLPPRALLARLTAMTASAALDMLTDGAADLPERHRTLRDAIAWSYDLLSAPEQQLFARLGCFVGGWTLAAAEAVCADEQHDGASSACFLNRMTVLLNNSLARRMTADQPEPRFTMLETIREYALEQLAARDERETVQRRHAHYYLDLAEAAVPRLQWTPRDPHFALLERERPNLRAAFEWLTAHEPAAGLRLAGALWWFWYLRSYWVEGRAWLRAALEHAPMREPTPMLAHALTGAGALAWVLTDFEAARQHCEQSVAIWRTTGDRRGLAYALMFLGMAVLRQGDYQHAVTLLEESITAFRAVDDRGGLAHALNALRQALVARGDLDAARARQQESVALWRALGDTWGLALALNGLGEINRRQGAIEQAIPLYEESLHLFRAIDDKRNTAILLHNLAHALLRRGDADRAAHLFVEGLLIDHEQGNVEWVLGQMAGLGTAAALRGEWEAAAHLLGFVHEAFQTTGYALWPIDQAVYEQTLAALHKRLETHLLRAAWERGRTMTFEQAIGYATAQHNLYDDTPNV
jgi:predicted ATPase/DNA-binding XRE family transcriptional regulator